MTSYFDALNQAMKWLAADRKTVFIGQGVGCAGTTMTDTLEGISPDKLIEFPVAEELQMGVCIGMALEGKIPICIYPRWNFMICAANQIVNHLDRLPIYSQGQYQPKVIVRVATPKTKGFYPGPQHDDDFSDAFEKMLRTVRVVRLKTADDIISGYQNAMAADNSTIMVEYTELYNRTPSGVRKDALEVA